LCIPNPGKKELVRYLNQNSYNLKVEFSFFLGGKMSYAKSKKRFETFGINFRCYYSSLVHGHLSFVLNNQLQPPGPTTGLQAGRLRFSGMIH
jgi:hypothetical protein